MCICPRLVDFDALPSEMPDYHVVDKLEHGDVCNKACSCENRIEVERSFWNGLNSAQKAATLAHEAAHLLGVDCEHHADTLAGALLRRWGYSRTITGAAMYSIVDSRPDAGRCAQDGWDRAMDSPMRLGHDVDTFGSVINSLDFDVPNPDVVVEVTTGVNTFEPPAPSFDPKDAILTVPRQQKIRPVPFTEMRLESAREKLAMGPGKVMRYNQDFLSLMEKKDDVIVQIKSTVIDSRINQATLTPGYDSSVTFERTDTSAQSEPPAPIAEKAKKNLWWLLPAGVVALRVML